MLIPSMHDCHTEELNCDGGATDNSLSSIAQCCDNNGVSFRDLFLGTCSNCPVPSE